MAVATYSPLRMRNSNLGSCPILLTEAVPEHLHQQRLRKQWEDKQSSYAQHLGTMAICCPPFPPPLSSWLPGHSAPPGLPFLLLLFTDSSAHCCPATLLHLLCYGPLLAVQPRRAYPHPQGHLSSTCMSSSGPSCELQTHRLLSAGHTLPCLSDNSHPPCPRSGSSAAAPLGLPPT